MKHSKQNQLPESINLVSLSFLHNTTYHFPPQKYILIQKDLITGHKLQRQYESNELN